MEETEYKYLYIVNNKECITSSLELALIRRDKNSKILAIKDNEVAEVEIK